ncbi:G0/G1 switch protein 2 [Monodelphis domestica]|uniref:G0/G1 switch 2 n=1 Tax=Monodelphis domestica TaxID=13616 RepID=F7GK66_MONDO|nr:G0/G1 switch protein 2 [Monodelphis domestica]
METVQELIPLAKEMMAQKPNGKMVKLYVLGSVLAFFGVMIGLVETVCSPFSAISRLREEDAPAATSQASRLHESRRREALPEKSKEQGALGGRSLSHRQHAS